MAKTKSSVEIKPEDHKTLSGLEPTIEISNQGHAPYDRDAVRESPTRSGLQPKGKKK